MRASVRTVDRPLLPRVMSVSAQGAAVCGWLLAVAAAAQVPDFIHYQGRVVVNGTNFDGSGQFKFAIVSGTGATTYWSHDGTPSGEPATAVSVPVSKGLYSVRLGESPMAPLGAAVFADTGRWLRVWFDGGAGAQLLSPDQPVGAVGYAMVAATVPGSGISGAIPDARLTGSVGIGTNAPAERLDVAGRIVVADSTNAASRAGTIRWTGRDFEGFDGLSWVSLTPMPVPDGMVYVPGGTFPMGWSGIAEPLHDVTVSRYFLAKCEVSYALWYSVLQWAVTNGYCFQNQGREGDDGSNGVPPTSSSAEPVTQVSWRDAVVWCNAYSERQGLAPVYTYSNAVVRDSRDANALGCDNAEYSRTRNGYRLPTESEWEYAARYGKGEGWIPGTWLSGATNGYTDTSACDAVAWYSPTPSPTSHTHAVATKLANQLGVFDMSGNVSEWCWDWHGVYSGSPATDPSGPAVGTYRVQRWSSYSKSATWQRTAYRASGLPNDKTSELGFRCARTAL